MSLKVTIKNENGEPTTLDVHEIHITSNDAANSINVARATATATVPSIASSTIPPVLAPATQQQSQFMQQEQQNKLNSFNANAAKIDNSMREQLLQPGLNKSDKDKIINDHQELHNQNTLTNYGINPNLRAIATTIGGTRDQRNKRAKRTRKHRRSRKRSTKR